MQHSLAALLCTALLSAATAAQDASFTTSGTACFGGATRAGSPSIRLSGTPPIQGANYTVTVTGPAGSVGVLMCSLTANLAGTDLTTSGMTGCRRYPTGSIASQSFVLNASGVAQITANASAALPAGTSLYYQAQVWVPGANPAGLLTSNLGTARLGREPDLTPAQIAQFAPIVRIHPAEAYRPMNADEFLARARFRHHRGFQSDQGFHRTLQQWITTDSHDAVYYGIPNNVLAAYTLHADGRNRRPRDANCGDSYNVFLQTDGRLTGPAAPTGVVPTYYHYRRVSDRHQIQFWWFCGFNDSVGTVNHQGDWEHVTVNIQRGAIVGAFFAAHEGGEFYGVGHGLRFVGTRPLVYMAKGSHASYPTTGTWTFGIDETADGGPEWNTGLMVRSLAAQPWKDFAGAWGEVGSTSTTTGPLGPWHKRNDP